MARATLLRIPATAICVGLGIVLAWWAVTAMGQPDVAAYEAAAARLRAGEPLYAPGSMNVADVYRYAPWFAALWSLVGSRLLLLLASLVAVAYVAWQARHAWPVNVLLVGALLGSVSDGNVQPLLVASLVWSRDRWTGPAWIAIAASIKAVPAAFALVYLGRGEWRRFALFAVITALAVVPMLAFDLAAYPTDAGERTILWGTPLYVPVVAAGIVATLGLARSRYAWLAAATLAVVALPRFWPYDLSWLLVALVPAEAPRPARTPEPAEASPAPMTSVP
jgi:hypothetical protein